MYKNLPSGKRIYSVLDAQQSAETTASADPMTAEAKSFSLDVDGQCPKCLAQMGFAIARNETVYYCDACRVSLPLKES